MKYEIIKTRTKEEENMLATYLEDGWVIKNAYPLHDCVEYVLVQLNSEEVGQALDKMLQELSNAFGVNKDEDQQKNNDTVIIGEYNDGNE